MEKKGVSTVIVVLILVLLVLVAVGILWVVVKNIIKKSSEEINLGKLTVDLEIREITCSTETGLRIRVKVKRNVGAGDLVGMKFLVNNGSEIKLFEIKDITLNELSEGEFYLDDDGQCTVEEVSVAPMFMTESGRYILGNIADTEPPRTPRGAPCAISCGECGSDGCGGICGTCSGPTPFCDDGICVVALPHCGNGSIDSGEGEVCDGALLGGESCITQGFHSGTLACYSQGHAQECTFDNSSCMTDIEFLTNYPGIIHWWRMNGNLDDEVGGNTGIENPVGGVDCTGAGSGVSGTQGCLFDGDDDNVDTTSTITIPDSPGGTISMWLRAAADNIDHKTYLGHSSSSSYIETKDGANWLEIRFDVGPTYHLDYTPMNISQWHLYTITFNDTSIVLYINGTLENTNYSYTPSDYIIDVFTNSYNNYFYNGTMDEVMLFNRALNSSEVLEIYNLDLS